MSEYSDLIKAMKFSFSRITAFENCPYAFYLNYLLRDFEAYPNRNNFFAENGSCAHQVYEELLKKEIEIEDCASRYLELFDDIQERTKDTIMRSTFNKCLDNFANLEEDWLDPNYEVVGIEQRIDGEINGVRFYGFLDVLLRDKRDGEFIIMDHKSAKRFFTRKGTVYSDLKKQFSEYKKQAYLYSELVKQKYGKFPKAFIWNHFKDNGVQTYVEFDKKEYEETLRWFNATFAELLMEEEFNPKEYLTNPDVKSDEFYCNNLCGFRDTCEYIQEYRRKHWSK